MILSNDKPDACLRHSLQRSLPWLLPLLLMTDCTRPGVTPVPDRGRLAHDSAVRGDQDRRAGDHRGKEGTLQLPGSRVDPIAADPSR
jgi:hypothetical protein